MKNFRKHIDDFFREKLGRYIEAPPEDVWEDLDKRLDTLVPAGTPGFRWGWHVAIVSLIAVLSIPFVHSFTRSHAEFAGAATEKSTSVTGKDALTQSENATVSASASSAGREQQQEPPADANAESTVNTGSNQTEETPAVGDNSNTGYSAYAANASAKKANRLASAANRKLRRQHVVMAENDDAPVYNSGRAVSAKEAEAFENAATTETAAGTSAPVKQPQPAAFKKAPKNEPAKPQIQNNVANTNRPAYRRFELGLKGGLEKGFNSDAASKIFIAPYIQYNLSSKFSIMAQPAIKMATVNSRTISSQSYYRANNDGAIVVDSITHFRSPDGGTMHENYTATYTYSQSHDSIVKSSVYGGSYVELELPILLKYNVTGKFSVYGGPNIVYSKTAAITEKTYTKQRIITSADTVIHTTDVLPITPDHVSINNSGKPISSYAGPLNPTQGSQLRLGYMLGFSYEYSRRWLFDAAVQQSPVNPDVKGDYNVNLPLSSPYFRLSVGYKLTHL